MLHVAIVEDEESERARIRECLSYLEESGRLPGRQGVPTSSYPSGPRAIYIPSVSRPSSIWK